MKKQKNILTRLSKVLLVFLMVFSQMYAPIEVLAEQLESTESTEEKDTIKNTEQLENGEEVTQGEEIKTTKEYTYTVTVNGEEVETYTVTNDNKVIKIHQEYDKEEGTYKFEHDLVDEEIDFTNKLYGTYSMTYQVLSNEDEVLETKKITINYIGDNSEILNNFTSSSEVIANYIIMDGKNKNLTVEEVLSNFDIKALEEKYDAKLIIEDSDGIVQTDTSEVTSDSKIILTNGIVTEEFSLLIIGDYNEDGILNIEDSKWIVDSILKEEESIFSILDATNSVYTTGIWNETEETKDTLSNNLVNKVEIYNGDELEVKYHITGFEYDILNGIEGKINYNKEILELESVDIENIYGNINEEGKFAYLLENYNSEDILMTIKFKAIKAGKSNISIDEIIGSVNGTKANLEDSVFTTVTVIELGKGGDVAEEVENQPVTTSNVEVIKPITTSYIKTISLSSDSFIKTLEIKGYNIKFDSNIYEYSLKVKNSVKSLDLTVILNDSNASYTVTGNENFKVGENTINIVVTAEDGSTSTYTLKVTREKANKEEEKENDEKNSSRTVIIILIILVIIGLIYVIFKDDEEEKESKK